jgi:hypothetical protein
VLRRLSPDLFVQFRSIALSLHHNAVSESGLLQAESLPARPGANLDRGQFHTSTFRHVRHNICDV